jgi:hypothetical protein
MCIYLRTVHDACGHSSRLYLLAYCRRIRAELCRIWLPAERARRDRIPFDWPRECRPTTSGLVGGGGYYGYGYGYSGGGGSAGGGAGGSNADGGVAGAGAGGIAGGCGSGNVRVARRSGECAACAERRRWRFVGYGGWT